MNCLAKISTNMLYLFAHETEFFFDYFIMFTFFPLNDIIHVNPFPNTKHSDHFHASAEADLKTK